jgi:hypothetical protein
MKGKSHTLYVEARGGHFVIELASDREFLQKKIGKALQSDVLKSKPAVIAQLSAMLAQLQAQPGRWDAALHSSDKALQDRTLLEIESEKDRIALGLTSVGQEFDIDALKESEWLLGGEIRPDLRGATTFRPTFYGGFNANAKRHAKAELSRLMSLKTSQRSTWERDPLFNSSNSYVCPGRDFKSPHLADNATEGGHLSLDHHPQAVSAHWNSIGSNSNHAVRVAWYSQIDNLTGMCHSDNAGKGGEPNLWKVGESFRGPGEP